MTTATFKCQSCRYDLIRDDEPCPFCEKEDLQEQFVKKETEKLKSQQNPKLSFFIAALAWLIMFVGSAQSSMLAVDGTLDYMSVFRPILDNQLPYHRIGFYLSLLALCLCIYTIIRHPKGIVNIIALVLSFAYIIPRFGHHALYLP